MKVIKKTIIIGLIILAIVLLIGGYLFMNEIKSQNIFDEIYYAWAYYPNILPTEPNFSNVKAFEGHPNDDEIFESKNSNKSLLLIFDKQYIESSLRVQLSIYVENTKEIIIVCSKFYAENEDLTIIINYNQMEKKIQIFPVVIYSKKLGFEYGTEDKDYAIVEQFLKENNITKEEIEKYKEYFLYEVTIGSWVDGNGELSKFTREKPGKFTIVDNTYSLLGEEWQER